MKTILAGFAVLLASCASAPTAGSSKIHVRAYAPVSEREADYFRSLALEGIRDPSPLRIEITISRSARPVNGLSSTYGAYAPAVGSASRNASSTEPLETPPPTNPVSRYPVSNLPSVATNDIMVWYMIRDASGKVLENRGSGAMVGSANHEKQYQDLVKKIAKRVAELNGTKPD